MRVQDPSVCGDGQTKEKEEESSGGGGDHHHRLLQGQGYKVVRVTQKSGLHSNQG